MSVKNCVSHTLFVLLVEAAVKRISMSHIPVQGVFGDQPDSGFLAVQDTMISVNFQGLPQVGEVSVASAPLAISLNVFSLQKDNSLLSWEKCSDVKIQTSVSSQFQSI